MVNESATCVSKFAQSGMVNMGSASSSWCWLLMWLLFLAVNLLFHGAELVLYQYPFGGIVEHGMVRIVAFARRTNTIVASKGRRHHGRAPGHCLVVVVVWWFRKALRGLFVQQQMMKGLMTFGIGQGHFTLSIVVVVFVFLVFGQEMELRRAGHERERLQSSFSFDSCCCDCGVRISTSTTFL